MTVLTSEAASRLELSRKELLDLGLRNPLINHRHRTKQVKVVHELSAEIYRVLVTESRKMSFDALPENKGDDLIEKQDGETIDPDTVGFEGLLAQPTEEPEKRQNAARHTGNRLQTNLASEKLQMRLLSIHNDARTYLEEQGVNILFLALGFLHWFEAPSAEEARRAPLLLIPVGLERSSARERFHVSFTGEDIGDNLSLLEKLRAEFSIKLPEIGDSEVLDLQRYFSLVEDAVKDDQRWYVDANEITLGFFSYGKFLMYKDLAAETWTDNAEGDGFSILESLLTDGFCEPESVFGDETHIDDVVSPTDLHQVKDADSSQILAILDVNAGRNLVLQGPPGTGKSQTITNIIAECVGSGRKVLFVSEKMAALDVVKRRLDEVGLGDAAIELHSHKTKKKQVLEELNRTLLSGQPREEKSTSDVQVLTSLRKALNAYCDAVNQTVGTTRTSFVRALGFALQNRQADLDLQPFDFGPMANWSDSEYRMARTQVERVELHLADSGPPSENPFRKSGLIEFLPSQKPRLTEALEEAESNTGALLSSARNLARAIGLPPPEIREDALGIWRAAGRALEAPDLEGVALTSSDWRTRGDELSALLKAGKALRQIHDRYEEWLIGEAWQQDLFHVRQHYVTKGRKWWRFLSGGFRRSKARLQGLCRKPLPGDVAEVIMLIDTVLDSQKHQRRYDELSALGASLFGARWTGENSDWDELEKLGTWLAVLHREIENRVLPEGIMGYLSDSPRVDELKDKVEAIQADLHKHEISRDQVVYLLKLEVSKETKTPLDLPFETQLLFLQDWRQNLDRLFHRVRFNQLLEELSAEGLEFVTSVFGDWKHPKGTLLRLFDYSWFNGIVEKAYEESPNIKKFDRTEHTRQLKEFSRLDHLLFRFNRVRLVAEHWKSLPKLSDGGELQIIKREINKRRRIMPIRRLISEAGRAIQAIKPVFMMSPMSIATYLPPGSVHFDLVVFDEASQVKPVDAFGAIFRGNQSVVVGDSKQLPPTSFFESLVESDDEDDFENVGDMESILSLFLGKGAPERMLRWHYRSRHDSLIAVSNYEFYDNRLVVFPCPGINPTARGLRFHHLPETVYERGTTRSNPREAKAVAKAVLEHAKEYPDLTLGVAAFSTAQRDAIEIQLELLRRADPSCEPFFNKDGREPFFVKNLENVQGDERDVIFISIGYGKTAEGYMTMSFGPLNRDGGERRLNVLITRARLAMDVFSNFTDDDIDLGRTQARGAVALKNFLAFARTGVLEQPYSTDREPDSPFEEEVIKALVQNGIEVEPQVGTAGFFIDIGVKDKENPGRYILGIECDGATYHSSRSARDRDRLRQEVLEGLGWRLHRIWSTEWYRDPRRELERVLVAIEAADRSFKDRGADESMEAPNPGHDAPIVREEVNPQEDGSHGPSVPYKQARPDINLGSNELHQLYPTQLFPFVYQVVAIESPIHKTELIRRITEGAGLKRAGRRIQNTVQAAINYGVKGKRIDLKGDHIWLPEMKEAEVRDRSDLDQASKKFEFVSPEEVRAAILQVVERGFSLNEVDAVTNAARNLGFLRVSAQAKLVLDTQLAKLVNDGSLVTRNGRVSAG